MTELSRLPPSTRRALAARLPGPLGRLVGSLGRAVERGDPRLGLFVGLPVAVLVAGAFAGRVWLAAGFEDKVLDQAFLRRSPIRESDRVLMVDLNDETYKLIELDRVRKDYGRVLLALHRLGVRRTVFDVEFKMVVPRPGEYDLESGEYLLEPADALLRDAIALSRNVTLAFHFDMAALEEDIRRAMPRLKDALAREFLSTPEDLAAASGLSIERIRPEFENLFQMATQALIRDRLARNPSLSFADLRQELLPGSAAVQQVKQAKILQYSFQAERGLSRLAARLLPVRVEGVPERLPHPDSLILPKGPFLDGADSLAAANAEADADGVLRRPWIAMMFRGRPCLYLGLEGALRAMAREGETVEPVLRTREFEIRVSGAKDGTLRRTIALPIDDEGRVLVDWPGNAQKQRGKKEPYFAHLPFHELVAFFEERYELMDQAFRNFLSKDSEERGQALHPEYAKLSDRLREFLAGRGSVPSSEIDPLEGRLDAIRRQVLSDLEADVASLQKAIPALKSPRAREGTAKEIARRQLQLSDLRGAYDHEARLRPGVEGKIAWIGSTSTAGGDLHALPLGIAVPGVDVPASVANMVLTDQALRHVPRWVDFAYVLGVGIFVLLAITHWNTMTVALPAAVGVTVVSLGIYAALFVGPAIVVSGAGPGAQALLCFALAAGFKELVTNRSKRKLQRELEKNTSPEMVKILMEHPEFISKPRKVTGTFLFSDVKSFTSISEKMSPDVLFPFINRMLEAMTRALKRHQAYIDKYVGDGVVALFGMPVTTPDHARLACQAALECQAALQELNAEFRREGLPEIQVRIGINSGDVKAGTMGAADRSSYTVMGDAVNLASRLEGANKNYETYIMIGESTRELVGDAFVVRELDRIRVVGKKLPVRVYELVGVPGGSLPSDLRFLELYSRALGLYQARQWPESIRAFEEALRARPGDRPSLNYVSRARDFLIHPPPADWEGVFELHSK